MLLLLGQFALPALPVDGLDGVVPGFLQGRGVPAAALGDRDQLVPLGQLVPQLQFQAVERGTEHTFLLLAVGLQAALPLLLDQRHALGRLQLLQGPHVLSCCLLVLLQLRTLFLVLHVQLAQLLLVGAQAGL